MLHIIQRYIWGGSGGGNNGGSKCRSRFTESSHFKRNPVRCIFFSLLRCFSVNFFKTLVIAIIFSTLI